MSATQAPAAPRAARVRDGAARVRGAVGRAVAPVAQPLTGLGRALLVLAAVAWPAGVLLGWTELLILAAACLLLIAVGLVWTLRPPALDVALALGSERVVAGETAAATVTATNPTGRTIGATRLVVPVGDGATTYRTGRVAPGASWQDTFVVPTARRGVIDLGPAGAVRGDPLGVARRERSGGRATTLYVHPVTISLHDVGVGLRRDLEGRTTNDLSNSDVAFHTLRSYVPGDDRRHIHWRSSAKVGQLLVRQFVDTRRSLLGIVLAASGWYDDDEYELGVSIAGSLGRTALHDGQQVTAQAGDHLLPSARTTGLLDALAGVERDEDGPDTSDLLRTAAVSCLDASIVTLVVSAQVPVQQLRAHARRFGQRRVVAVRCGAPRAQRRVVGSMTTLEVTELADLRALLRVKGLSQ